MNQASTLRQYKRQSVGRKTFLSTILAAALLFCFQVTAFAAEQNPAQTISNALSASNASNGDENTNNHDVIPIAITEPEWVWHPISIVNEPINGFNAVRRTYALPPEINPIVISTSDFEMFGQRFSFAYVIQQSTADESFMQMREAITIQARSRNLNDILPNLEQEIWFERDGFAGALVLDLHSITSEVAGTSSQTSTATRHRTYSNLSSADNSLIPRTITDGGTIFHLSAVDWQSNSISLVDGHPITSSYTANATYAAQVTQTTTTGYTITAEYVGTVFRTAQGKTLYTAIFYGEPIVEVWISESEQGSSSGFSADLNEFSNAQQDNAAEPTQPNISISTSTSESTNSSDNNIANNTFAIPLDLISILIGFVAFGAAGFFLAKYLLGHKATIYSINSPREIVKAGKIKMNINSPEPTILLDKTVGQNPAKTDRYIIQIARKTIPKLVNKVVRVILQDKEATHKVPEKALGMNIYEFEVNFSDDEMDELGEMG